LLNLENELRAFRQLQRLSRLEYNDVRAVGFRSNAPAAVAITVDGLRGSAVRRRDIGFGGHQFNSSWLAIARLNQYREFTQCEVTLGAAPDGLARVSESFNPKTGDAFHLRLPSKVKRERTPSLARGEIELSFSAVSNVSSPSAATAMRLGFKAAQRAKII
jgi:hypothetical protein